MKISETFTEMVSRLSARYKIPQIRSIFLPAFFPGGQSRESEFMAVMLEDETVGISYVLLADDRMSDYNSLRRSDLEGKSPVDFALRFGSDDPIENMLGLACLNAICQHIIVKYRYYIDIATDSLGLTNIKEGDVIGMVGFFYPLIKRVKDSRAELIIIEKDPGYIKKYPHLNVSMDTSQLSKCSKIICTSTTVFNNSLDHVLSYCNEDAFISIIGPTAGYFPDPLFDRGVDVVGGTMVKDGPLFMELIKAGERWGTATQKFCFIKNDYKGLPL